MAERKSINWVLVCLVAALTFCVGHAPASAEDWRELHKLDKNQLDRQIEVLHGLLDRNKDDYKSIKGLALVYHIKAEKNKKAFAPKAVAMLTRSHEKDNSDMEVLCYLGSATTMMAQITWNPMKKMQYVNKGIGMMDKAVRKSPNNLSVRMTRGFNSMSLPKFLNRAPLALEDFEHLADLVNTQPERYGHVKIEVESNLERLYAQQGKSKSAAAKSAVAED